MIIEIIVIILSFLITGYGIYRFTGNEVAEKEIIVQGNGGDQNVFINSDCHHNNIRNNTNINNNNTNNIYSPKQAFKLKVINIIIIKEKNKTIDWKNIEETANNIYRSLKCKTDQLAEIKGILNKEKLKRGEMAVKKWISKNKENFNNEKYIQKIVDQIYNSEENTYTFKKKGGEEKTLLLTPEEIKNIIQDIEPGKFSLMQENEMEELEKQVQMEKEEKRKEEEDRRKKEEEERLKKEKRLKNIENKAKEAQGKIVAEPEENDPNSTVICFRYPDGEKRKDRRFLKNHTIQNLYDYVTSLGKEIYTEEENNKFSLYQPFPPKKYVQMKNTLEKEGLFPNAVIQIREE